jgi:hypothetical protein
MRPFDTIDTLSVGIQSTCWQFAASSWRKRYWLADYKTLLLAKKKTMETFRPKAGEESDGQMPA